MTVAIIPKIMNKNRKIEYLHEVSGGMFVCKDSSSSYASEVGRQVSTVEPPLLSSNGVFL